MAQDKVLLEILKNRFQAIVDEMAYNILRTGHTVFVKETADFGTTLVSPAGEMFAAPVHLGVSVLLGLPCRRALAAIADYEPGDVCLANDPYITGGLSTHLPDFFVWQPIFRGDRIVAFSMGFIHSSDVGGKVPGSISPSSYDIFQEGIRLPPCKLYRHGELDEKLLEILLLNCRIPEQNWGDLKALIGAMHTGERRLLALMDRYGSEQVTEGIEGVLDYAEHQARALIDGLPDGEYPFTDFMEGDGFGSPPIRVNLTLRVRGSDLTMDFAGTDPQVRAALNLPSFSENGHYMLVPAVINYLRTKSPAIPFNSGLVRPIHIAAPEGSLVNPRNNAACGVRAATMFRAWEASMASLSRMDPAYIPAAGGGQFSPILIACPDPETGRTRVSVAQPLAGGSGARPSKDGIDGADFSSYIRNIPTEVLESEMPVEVLRYGLRADSAGAGQYRGGLGVEFTFRSKAPTMTLTARGLERYHFRPWGRKGGRPGGHGRTVLNPGGPGEKDLGKIDALDLEPGDVIQFLTQAGGGYGSPLLRDASLTSRDVRAGILTANEAREVYGVILRADGEVDADATAAERQRRMSAEPKLEYDFGPERAAYDAIWTPEVRAAVDEVLRDVPGPLHATVRARVMTAIDAKAATAGGRIALDEVVTWAGQVRSRYWQGGQP